VTRRGRRPPAAGPPARAAVARPRPAHPSARPGPPARAGVVRAADRRPGGPVPAAA